MWPPEVEMRSVLLPSAAPPPRALDPEAQRLAVQLCNTVEFRLENDEGYQHLNAAVVS